jgi:membrane protease subunit (stomatin/prohibitin family)
MSIFNKNPNETAYVGGKKHWADVIKNSGPGELLIWRQPEEDFNTNSTVVVMPGEEAIFIKGGVIEQVFENGTYKLSTENYPFISRLRNVFTGGVSTFNCAVYFIRKALSMEILWGTSSPIQVRDPVMMIMTSVRARGAYKVRIDNGANFLTKLLGNNIPFALQDELTNYFNNEFQQHIKSSIAKAMLNANKEILGICAEQNVLAQNIEPILQEILDDYGVKLITFSIAGIDIPENDPNRQKLENAFSSKGVMNILGADWGRQQATEILHDIANNPGSGGVAGVGAGLGMGVAAGGVLGGIAQQMLAPMQQQQPPQPVQPQPSGRFTQKSATTADGKASASVADEIIKLKGLLDAGVLAQDEFDAMKKKLLGL